MCNFVYGFVKLLFVEKKDIIKNHYKTIFNIDLASYSKKSRIYPGRALASQFCTDA